MPKIKMPKKPSLNSTQATWDKYEKRMKQYVASKNERVRRRELKDNLVSKIKV
ncbi:hypothetical protein [Emticicia soli]|uniref:Uncharacterized protein n=1 Tax=Emticicia soli TaxID=2027878 RepID=A0ABW5J688_9BACT